MSLPSSYHHLDQPVIRSQKPHLLLLPSELLVEIFSYLPYPSLTFLRKAHTRFNQMFSTTELLPKPIRNVSPRAFSPHGPIEMTPQGGTSVPIPPAGRQDATYTVEGILPGMNEVVADIDLFGRFDH